MSHKDDDLNELLKPLRDLSPNDLQMRKWQTAAQNEARPGQTVITTTRSQWAFQLIAAMLVGFIMGAIVIKSLAPTAVQNPTVAQNSNDDATFEHSHTNLD